MTDAEFQDILNKLSAYLAMDKTFISNPFREMEIKKAIELAHELFPDAKIYIKDDPLQLGALILCIEDYDLDVTEIKTFSAFIEKADNFEVYAIENGNVKMAVLFRDALVRI